MADIMIFPDDPFDFIDEYSFEDKDHVYTNGSKLISVFRVKQALEHYFAKPSGWVSVKDRPPKSGEHVLATCEIRFLNGSKKRYVCEAYHAEEHSIPVSNYDDTDCCDYSEEDDEYYLKEGWYEVIHNWDEYASVVIEDFVTHWMPMPKAPEPPKEEE